MANGENENPTPRGPLGGLFSSLSNFGEGIDRSQLETERYGTPGIPSYGGEGGLTPETRIETGSLGPEYKGQTPFDLLYPESEKNVKGPAMINALVPGTPLTNPDVAQTVKDQFAEFLPKIHQFLYPEKSNAMLEKFTPIIEQLAGVLKNAIGTPNELTAASHLAPAIATLFNAAQTGQKIPAENLAQIMNAIRPHISQTYEGGPGEMATRSTAPWGTETIGKGSHENRAQYMPDNIVMQGHFHIAQTALQNAEKAIDPAEKKQWLDMYERSIKGIDALRKERNEFASTNKRAQWLTEARKMPQNQGRTEQELLAYFDKTYGGK
jgi:hypothetical protein